MAPGLVELGRTLARDTARLDPVLMLAGVTPLVVCVVCLLAGFHGDPGMPMERPWMRAAAVGAVVAVSWAAAHLLLPGRPWYLPVIGDLGALPGWGIVLGGPLYLVARAPLGRRRGGHGGAGRRRLRGDVLPDRLASLALAVQTRHDPGFVPHLRWRPPPSR